MNKKVNIIFIICTILIGLTSCSKDAYIPEDNNQNWIKDVSYNELNNSAKVMKSMEVSENQILLFPQTDIDGYSLITYLDEDKMKIMEANPSNICSLQNPSDCSSAMLSANNFTYYKGKLYYLSTEYSDDTGMVNDVLYVSDLDGMNRKELLNLDELLYEYPAVSNYATSIEIHRDTLYMLKGGNLFYTSLKDINPKMIQIEGLKEIRSFYLKDDAIYLYTPTYKIDDKLQIGVILETSLNNDEVKIIKEGINFFIGIDEKNLIYVEDEIIYLYNFETKQTKKIIDDKGYYLLISDDYYIFDNTMYAMDDSEIVLFDKDGNQLTSKNIKDEFHYPQLVKDNKYYVSSSSEFWYYELSDTGISDRKMITMSEE